MIHITYYPSTNDSLSSGHIFFEIFTVFIFSLLIECKPVYNSTWKNCLIISRNSLLNFTTQPLDKYEKIINIDQYVKWESISFDDFCNIKTLIIENRTKYSTILITLRKVCVIHPDVLYRWYNRKLISTNIYSEKAIPLLQNMYYYDNNREQINAFAIHMRRGDLCKWSYDNGFTIDYYSKIINIINNTLNIPINIYTESIGVDTTTNLPMGKNEGRHINYDDISILQNLKNVKIYAGKKTDFSIHFNELCRSKYLMVAPSSFSLWAGFITDGIVLVDKKCIKCRPNLFRNSENIPNFIVFENFIDNIETLKKIIE